LQAKLSLPSTRWPPTQHHRAARTVVVRRRQEGAAAEQAERVLRNLTRQLDHDAAGVSASILEGLDEMLTVIRLGLPDGLRRSLGCTNAIESLMAVVRQVCCNGKRWRDHGWHCDGLHRQCWRPRKGFRRLKAHKQLPILRTALQRHQQAVLGDQSVIRKNLAA
jgi:putative transposase